MENHLGQAGLTSSFSLAEAVLDEYLHNQTNIMFISYVIYSCSSTSERLICVNPVITKCSMLATAVNRLPVFIIR